MNAFMKSFETINSECKLSEISKGVSLKTIDYKELDKPIVCSFRNSFLPKNEGLENDQKGSASKDLPSAEGKQIHHIPADSTTDLTDVNEAARPLTDEEKVYFKEKLGCSDHLLDNATIDDNGKVNIKTINEGKEGQEGENGVKYERKTIIVNGVEVEGVFPVFDSAFDMQLPEDLLKSTDAKQMECCNQKLKEAVENDPQLAKQFTPEQIEQIKNGETPDGYTWHHNEETGKMQLVKTEDHQTTRHTGGKAIWGGGKENR